MSHEKRVVVASHSAECYASGEMPGPNHKGRWTGSGSDGDDMAGDGGPLAGPQPYEGDNRAFPQCAAGSLRVRVGTSKAAT